MKDVFFIRFSQKHRELEKCTRWAKPSNRQNFTAESVHLQFALFFNRSRPTSDHPVPIPATATKYDVYQAINVLQDAFITKIIFTAMVEKFIKKPRRSV